MACPVCTRDNSPSKDGAEEQYNIGNRIELLSWLALTAIGGRATAMGKASRRNRGSGKTAEDKSVVSNAPLTEDEIIKSHTLHKQEFDRIVSVLAYARLLAHTATLTPSSFSAYLISWTVQIRPRKSVRCSQTPMGACQRLSSHECSACQPLKLSSSSNGSRLE